MGLRQMGHAQISCIWGLWGVHVMACLTLPIFIRFLIFHFQHFNPLHTVSGNHQWICFLDETQTQRQMRTWLQSLGSETLDDPKELLPNKWLNGLGQHQGTCLRGLETPGRSVQKGSLPKPSCHLLLSEERAMLLRQQHMELLYDFSWLMPTEIQPHDLSAFLIHNVN